MELKFETQTFARRQKSMLKVDFRRMFTQPLFYIMVGACLAMPILILVMTTMMDGSTTVNPTTGVETTMESFTNVWQIIGSLSGESSAMDMSMTGMININMLYFILAVLVCGFISADFKSGYAKNVFTVRPKRIDYVVSKTLVGFVGGAAMLLAFFIGSMLGGAIAGLPFDTGAAGTSGIVMCLISKMFLVAVFAAIFTLMSIVGKQRTWLSILLSLAVSMLLFNMIPMITPLDSSFLNVVLCLAGGAMFSVGLGAISNIVLKKTSVI